MGIIQVCSKCKKELTADYNYQTNNYTYCPHCHNYLDIELMTEEQAQEGRTQIGCKYCNGRSIVKLDDLEIGIIGNMFSITTTRLSEENSCGNTEETNINFKLSTCPFCDKVLGE